MLTSGAGELAELTVTVHDGIAWEAHVTALQG